MKKGLTIMLAVIMIFSLCIGTALAKNSKDKPDNGNKGKDDTVQDDTKKKDTGKSDTGKDADATAKSKGQLKQEMKEAFKTAVSGYLAKIKANKKAFGQAGGLDKLDDISDQIEKAIETIIAGGIPVTDAQLAAIKAEIAKIKAYKAALKTDKTALQASWLAYIRAKKTYDISAGTAALQKVIDQQVTRISARKGIFASMAVIINILREALSTPAPAPTPAPAASPEPSPSASASVA